MQNYCDLCGEEAKLICPECEITHYCSYKCVEADEDYHENVCFNRNNPERHKVVAACIEKDIECAYHRNLDRKERREMGDTYVSEDEDEDTDGGSDFANDEIGDMIDFLGYDYVGVFGSKKRKEKKAKRKGKGSRRYYQRQKRRAARKQRHRTSYFRPGERLRLRRQELGK